MSSLLGVFPLQRDQSYKLQATLGMVNIDAAPFELLEELPPKCGSLIKILDPGYNNIPC